MSRRANPQRFGRPLRMSRLDSCCIAVFWLGHLNALAKGRSATTAPLADALELLEIMGRA